MTPRRTLLSTGRQRMPAPPPEEPAVASPEPNEAPEPHRPTMEGLRTGGTNTMDDYGGLLRPKKARKKRDPEAPKPVKPPKPLPPPPKLWHGLDPTRTVVRRLIGGLKLWTFDRAGAEHRVFAHPAGQEITLIYTWRHKPPREKRRPLKASAYCRTCQSHECEACYHALGLIDPTIKPV